MDQVHNNSDLVQEALRSRLDDWRRRFDHEVTPSLDRIEYCSTNWAELWKRAWAEYDELEKDRITSGFTRLTWQDQVEKSRSDSENFMRKYKTKSPTLTTHDWSNVSLGMILEKHLRSPVSADQSDVARALERWYKFREVAAQHPNFGCSLSFPQKASWTLLTHWWSAAYQDPSFSEMAKSLLETARAAPNRVKIFHGEPYLDTETFVRTRKSVYNATMYALFNEEFNPRRWFKHFKELGFMTLSFIRTKAIQHAAAQRLAYTSYAKMRQFDLPDIGPYVCSVDLPCPWLSKEHTKKEKPFYLWDVERKRTVKVEDLPDEPEYCCVSHTWGRWRMNDVPIQGVPWLVPSNRRFDVESLPEHLQRIQPKVPFIWIDLFCIPQDGSPKAEEEINRQALIFQNASRCIAWMNDVTEWTRTGKALDWIAISYLHATTSTGIYDTESLLGPLYREAKDISELFTHEIEIPENEKLLLDQSNPPAVVAVGERKLAEPACWFSSLWTLQEAMLCPSLTLVSRDWTPLEDRLGTAIPLDALFGILNTVEDVWYDDKPYKSWTNGSIKQYSRYRMSQEADPSQRWPRGARLLFDLCLVTRMGNLLESPEPAGLLVVANTRQSTSSRAPAIMSALGITDWYKPNDGSHGKADLVLNCYPLPFVREAATKLGARFYGAGGHVEKPSDKTDALNSGTKGSMMPFTAKSGWFGGIAGVPVKYGYLQEDHLAVKTWIIGQDGSVRIKQAGILASTEDGLDNESVLRGFHSNNGRPIRFIDWVNDLPKGMCMFAVSLLRNSGWQQGLVVRGYRKHWYSPTQRLMKVGNFVIPDSDFPPTTKVDWMVW
ncbi:MAG: hypothetical protein Q9163_000364 [Psora crenata]